MKSKGMMVLIILLSFCLCLSAQQEVKKVVGQKQLKQSVANLKILIKTDLRVEYIYASNCPCHENMNQVGVIFMPNVWVTISNYPCANGQKFTADAEIQVSYFDVGQNKEVTKKAVFSPLQPYPTNTWVKKVKVINGPILAKKSHGITATVVIKNQDTARHTYKDCNTANNTKTVYKCNIPIVE